MLDLILTRLDLIRKARSHLCSRCPERSLSPHPPTYQRREGDNDAGPHVAGGLQPVLVEGGGEAAVQGQHVVHGLRLFTCHPAPVSWSLHHTVSWSVHNTRLWSADLFFAPGSASWFVHNTRLWSADLFFAPGSVSWSVSPTRLCQLICQPHQALSADLFFAPGSVSWSACLSGSASWCVCLSHPAFQLICQLICLSITPGSVSWSVYLLNQALSADLPVYQALSADLPVFQACQLICQPHQALPADLSVCHSRLCQLICQPHPGLSAD